MVKRTLILSILFFTSCLNVSINNVWKVPDTKLTIAVEKRKPEMMRAEVERTMILRDNYLDKAKISLSKGLEKFARLNIYQISGNQYVLRDAFEVYQLDTQAKTLTKTSPAILTATFEDATYPKFIGAFDTNENGGWRYIPASERAEIQLGKEK